MRVLFIADHELWPPFSGIAQRMYHPATGLARRHDVTLVVMERQGVKAAQFPDAGLFCSVHAVPYATCRFASDPALEVRSRVLGRMRRAIISCTPDVVLRFESTALKNTLRGLAERNDFDVVWATREHFAEQALTVGCAVVVDLPDIESESHARFAERRQGPLAQVVRRLEVRRIRAWEQGLLDHVAAVAVCRSTDAGLLRLDASRVFVVRNGVSDVPEPRRELERHDEVLFVGSLDYEPNVDAVLVFHDQVLPLIRTTRPSTRFVVVGRQPWPAVKVLDDGDSCIVRADVADLTEYYDRAALVVVPMRLGSGTRIKVIEAMARGKAVVSTPTGAEGIEGAPG